MNERKTAGDLPWGIFGHLYIKMFDVFFWTKLVLIGAIGFVLIKLMRG